MIGIDLISIKRVEKFYNRFGENALLRFLNEDEIILAKSSESMAGLWAAKEAAAKALGTGIGKECSFHDIMIKKSPKGAPELSFKEDVKNRFKIEKTSLSISHDGGFAVAAVMIKAA